MIKISDDLKKMIGGSLKPPKDELEKFNGKGNLIPFAGNVMPNRLIMLSAALDQFVEPINGELPKCNTVYWDDINRSTTVKFPEKDMEVLHIIPKYVNGERTCVTAYILIDDDDVIHLEMDEGYGMTNEDYGYKTKTHIEEEGQKLSRKDTISRPHSYDEDLKYKPGINTNTIYLTSNETTEDAFMCSESFMRKVSNYKVYHYKDEFDLNNTVIKNLYGTEGNYQPFPLVGEKIHDNPDNPHVNTAGTLLSYSNASANGMFIRSNQNLMKISEDDVDKVYPNDSLVVDITVRQAIDEECKSEFLKDLIEDNREFEEEVYSTLYDYKDKGYEFSSEAEEQYLKYKYIYEHGYCFRRGKHDNIPKHKVLIDIKLVKVNIPFVGQKFIGQHGNKGVCSVVLSDKDSQHITDEKKFAGVYKDGAFKTADGEDVDFIMATPGVPNRGNTGQLNLRTINQMSKKLVKHLKKEDYSDQEECELITLFVSIFSKEQAKIMEEMIEDHGEKKFMDWIYNRGIMWCLEPFSHGINLWTYNVAVELFEEIGVEYYDGSSMGKDVIYVDGEPRFEAEVGELYIYLLKQDALKNTSIRSRGAYNMQNNVTRTLGKKKHTDRYSTTPIKQSTDDMFLLMGMLEPETVHKLFSVTDSSIIETLNSHLNVMGIDLDIDSDK